MSYDFEDLNNEKKIEDATTLDSLFDAPVESTPGGSSPTEFYYTAEEKMPDATGIDFDDDENDDSEEEKPKKKKKSKKVKETKPKKKRTGLIIIIALVILGLLAGAYWHFFGGKKFNVSFTDGDGNVIETVKLKEGKTVELPEAPKKEGYVFIEWQLNGKKYEAGTLVGSDITLSAFYKKAMKVTFLYEDGKEYMVVEVGEGETVEKPEKDPEVKNKAFVTWMTEDKKVFSFMTPITEDITLIAKMKDYIKPTGLAYANPEYRIYVNEEKDLPAVVTPGNTTETVMYESSDTEIFSVDNRGRIKGLKEGTATLTAKVEGLVATTTITVEEKPVTGLTIQEGNTLKIARGKSVTLHTVIVPEDATHKEVTWRSSDDTIASISNDGVLTAVKKGTCKIIVSSRNNITYEMDVEVYVGVERVEISGVSNPYMYSGNSVTIEATIIPSDADIQTVNWNIQGVGGLYSPVDAQISGNKVIITAGSPSTLTAINISAEADGVTSSSSVTLYIEPLVSATSDYYTAHVGEEFSVYFNLEGTISVGNESLFSYCNIMSSGVSGTPAVAGTTTITIVTPAGQSKTVTLEILE